MVFRTFDRLLFVKMETTEGENIFGDASATAITPPAAADYIESVEPTFSITNREYDRNPTRMSITPAPKTVTGSGSALGDPSASVEISFGIELAGAGVSASATTVPNWAKLLTCCGMEQQTLTSITLDGTMLEAGGGTTAPTPFRLRNREQLSWALDSGTPLAYSDTAYIGRSFGGTSFKDTIMYYVPGASPDIAPTANDGRVFGQATDVWAGTTANKGPYATGTTAPHTRTSLGWIPTSSSILGGSTSTSGGSCSIALYLSNTNQYLVATGCRGNVEFSFASGDRAMMNFTMTGKLYGYGDSAVAVSPTTTGVEQPPGFTNVNLGLYESSYGATNVEATPYTGSIFNAMTMNLSNEVTIRENVSNSTGYDCAYITGRASSMTFNPDAKIQTGTYEIFERFLSGEQTGVEFTMGSTAGNKFRFRAPFAQFSGIADGNRDEVTVYDSTTTLTGGDMGESVQQDYADLSDGDVEDGSNILDPRLGTNNEFHLILEGN